MERKQQVADTSRSGARRIIRANRSTRERCQMISRVTTITVTMSTTSPTVLSQRRSPSPPDPAVGRLWCTTSSFRGRFREPETPR